MTWSLRIAKQDGTIPGEDYYACQTCKHNEVNPELPSRAQMPCNIPKIASSVSTLLTNVDVGSDGHMAAGEAILKCHGYECAEESGALSPEEDDLAQAMNDLAPE